MMLVEDCEIFFYETTALLFIFNETLHEGMNGGTSITLNMCCFGSVTSSTEMLGILSPTVQKSL